MARAKRSTADETEALLAAIGRPAPGAGWAEAARDAALSRLRQGGLPHRRDEYWRYTDPARLNAPAAAAIRVGPDEAPVFSTLDKLHIVFTDGVFDAEASDDLAGANLEIEQLGTALGRDIHWARDVFGLLEAAGQSPVPRPHAALNTALAGHGVVIRATGPVARPVVLRQRHAKHDVDSILHHIVRIDAGASLTLLEMGVSGARTNDVLEADIAAGGAFHHIRDQGRNRDRIAVTAVFARLAERAVFKTFTLGLNGALTRNEAVVTFAGNGGVAHVAGAAVGDGGTGAFHHDDTVFVTHDAVGCESRQVFKKVLRNGAVGVFQGKILVKQHAQKTDGYQISQSLLLDDDSQFLAKPELEIYADDVACSHGSTTGAIDEGALFYLRSRGVPRREAENLLVLSFLADALAEIEDPTLQAELLARLEGWMGRHRG